MCLAQGYNPVTPVRLIPAAPWSRVKHSTNEPLRSHIKLKINSDKELLQPKPLYSPLNWNETQLKQGMHYNDPKLAKLKKCKFIKNSFSSLNFHMHIFNKSVTYLQSIKRIH